MIDRYNSLSDTVPHEEYILCVCESGKYAGHPFTRIIDDVRSVIPGDKLTVQDLYPSAEELKDLNRIKQNSVWVINVDDCLAGENGDTLFKREYLKLQMHLETRDYPNEAGIFLCVDDVSASQLGRVKSKFPPLTIANSKELLVGILCGHFSEANPMSTRGKEKILRWNNEVCDDLGIS